MIQQMKTFKSRIITSFFVDGRKDQGNLKLLEIKWT